jgi:site-specific recombinase XerD
MPKSQALIPTAPISQPRLPAITTDVAERTRRYVGASLAANTQRSYATHWKDFATYCQERGYESLPASHVAVIDYLTFLADVGAKPSTISVKAAAIHYMHTKHEHPSPTDTPEVKTVVAGIRRELKARPTRKAPTMRDDIDRMAQAIPQPKRDHPAYHELHLRALRDLALLLLGFAGAFRRSELVGLNIEDLEFRAGDRGRGDLVVLLRKSKTDQEGEGLTKVIPVLDNEARCPVHALSAWISAAGIESGPVFRGISTAGAVNARRLSDQMVARIIKQLALAAGLDPANYAGHSLRAGFATQAAKDGVPTQDIREVTHHKSDRMLGVYIRQGGQAQTSAIRRVMGE